MSNHETKYRFEQKAEANSHKLYIYVRDISKVLQGQIG